MRSERAKPTNRAVFKLTSERPPASLIAKWKKTGYEKLCCLRCIQTRVSVDQGGLVVIPGAYLELL